MEAVKIVRQVGEDGKVQINIPQFKGMKVELIILSSGAYEDQCPDIVKIQEQSEFCRKVVLSEEEDVWNGLI